MPGLVTKETDRSVTNYLDQIGNESKKEDSRVLLSIMEEMTQKPPKIWGNEMVPDFLIGFGKYKYKRKSGKEEFEWFNMGFAPRKNKITIYMNFDISLEEQLLKDLGKCKWGKGCLYINKLKDVDLEILKQLILKGKDKKWH